MEKSAGSGKILTTLAMGATSISLLAIALLGPQLPEASGNYFTPPPVFVPPPTTHNQPYVQPIPNPLDVVYPMPGHNVSSLINPAMGPSPLAGISSAKWPGSENLKGPTDFILVQCEPGTNMERQSPYVVSLTEGTVLASVKRPSNMGILTTPVGQVAFTSNSDAFISYSNGVLRVRNVDGVGAKIYVNITSGPAAGQTFTVAPGHELVISDHKLTRQDLRPNDGIMRRQAQTFANGFAAVSQYHVESALNQSAVVLQLNQKESDTKARRIISDMSRMAAVLNQVEGQTGFN